MHNLYMLGFHNSFFSNCGWAHKSRIITNGMCSYMNAYCFEREQTHCIGGHENGRWLYILDRAGILCRHLSCWENPALFWLWHIVGWFSCTKLSMHPVAVHVYGVFGFCKYVHWCLNGLRITPGTETLGAHRCNLFKLKIYSTTHGFGHSCQQVTSSDKSA